MLRLNSLEIEEIVAPSAKPEIVFRDFFNRDDSLDVNKGVASEKHWVKIRPCLDAEGSQVSGAQEAGIVLLANITETGKLDATFVGVALDSSRPETTGCMIYRVDDGKGGHRTNLEIPDTALPVSITEGEFEIIVEHDVSKNLIRNIKINGVNVTDHIRVFSESGV